MTEAIYDAGFNSSGRFYAQSSEILGMTPSAISRRRCAAARSASRSAECSLGSILVAATRKRRVRDPAGRRSGSAGARSAGSLSARRVDRRRRGVRADWSRKVVGFVEAPASGLDLPLDVRGTAFQQRVWQALRGDPARGARRATRRSRHASARRNRCARWRRPAPRMRSRWRFPAIAWCATMAGSRATAGASSASAHCWIARRAR